MHCQIISGTDFNGCLGYIFGKPGAKAIATHFLLGDEPSEWTKELKFVASQASKRLKKPVLHLDFSPHPDDDLGSDEQKATDFVQKYLEKMGWERCQWVLAKHNDTKTPDGTDRPHYHAVVNRVPLGEHKAVDLSWCGYKTQNVLRELRDEFGLRGVRQPQEIERKPNTVGQERRYRREQLEYETGKIQQPPELSIRVQLQNQIDKLTKDYPTLANLQSRLEQIGVETRITQTVNGAGISYAWKGVAFSGTSLGRGYTLPGLRRYGRIRDEGRGQKAKDRREWGNTSTDTNNDTATTASNLALAILYDTKQITGLNQVRDGTYKLKWHPGQQELSVEADDRGEILRTGVEVENNQVNLDIVKVQQLQQQDVEQLQKMLQQLRSRGVALSHSWKNQRPTKPQLQL